MPANHQWGELLLTSKETSRCWESRVGEVLGEWQRQICEILSGINLPGICCTEQASALGHAEVANLADFCNL